MLIAVKKAAALQWCHVVPWRTFGPTACGMFLASSLKFNLFLGSPVLNQLEGDWWPSPSVAFSMQLPDQVLKALACTIAWFKSLLAAESGVHPARLAAAKRSLESALQLAVNWLPGFSTCQEALGVAAGNILPMEVQTSECSYHAPCRNMHYILCCELLRTHAPAIDVGVTQSKAIRVMCCSDSHLSLPQYYHQA